MRKILISSLIAIASTGCSSFAKRTASHQEIVGTWSSEKTQCSSGASYNGNLKSVSLTATPSKMSFVYLGSNQNSESLNANFWQLQDNLLIFTDEKTIFVMEALMPSNDELILRQPIIGIAGECPDTDLLVITLKRMK